MKRPEIRIPRVEVSWVDSAVSGGWRSLEEFRGAAQLAQCVTVGLLIKKTKKLVVVAQSAAKDGDVADAIAIPISCVRSIRYLKRR